MVAILLLATLLMSCSSAGTGGEVSAPTRAPAEEKKPEAVVQEVVEPDPVDALEALREAAGDDLNACAAWVIATSSVDPGVKPAMMVEAALRCGRPALALDAVPRDLDAGGLALLGGAYARAGQADTAVAIADGIAEGKQRDAVLVAVVDALARAGDVEAAEEVLARIGGQDERKRAAVHVAEGLARKGDLEAAWMRVEKIEGAVVDVVRAAAEAGHVKKAGPLAAGIEQPAVRALAFLEMSVALDCGEALAKATSAALEDPEAGKAVLARIVVQQIARGDINAAWSAAKAIPDEKARSKALAQIALEHGRQGNGYMAFKVTEVIESEAVRMKTWWKVLELDVEHGDVEEAEDAFREIRKGGEGVADALCLLSGAVVKSGDRDRADSLVFLADGKDDRIKVRGCLAVEYARMGDDKWAEKYLELMTGGQQEVLVSMAVVHADAGRTKKVKKIVAKLPDEMKDRGRAQVVRAMAVSGEVDAALEMIQEIGDDAGRASALLWLAGAGADLGRWQDVLERTGEAMAIGAVVDLPLWSEGDLWGAKAERTLLAIHLMGQGAVRQEALESYMELAGQAEAPELLEIIRGVDPA